MRAEALIDRDAVAANLQRLADAARVPLMAVVKADGYGHGALEMAKTARAWGAEWLGVALPSEALALRAAGDSGRILAWLWAPGDPDVPAAVAAGVDLSVSSLWALDEVRVAARSAGVRARVHLKFDTGLSRNGAPREDWGALCEAAALAEVEVVGLWSHLASGDVPGDPSVEAQRLAFEEACAYAAHLGPSIRHLANSGAALLHPSVRYELVRTGIAMVGIAPAAELGMPAELGLRPAMTLRARLASVKTIDAGTAVSYGRAWIAGEPTRIGLVPLGYADGIPRAASGRAEVSTAGSRCPVLGRIAMDQFVVAVPEGTGAGDEVLVFGDGSSGEPLAEDWAAAAGTIGYEIVTRIGPRVPRRYIGGTGP